MATDTSDDWTVVEGIPWTRKDREEDECWHVDVQGIHVWVKNYGPKGKKDEDNPWWGWRNGVGGSPVGDRHRTRLQAMKAGKRIAQVTAVRKIEEAQAALTEQVAALREVVETIT